MNNSHNRASLGISARLLLLLFAVLATCPSASAYLIQNNTNYTAICAIYNGDSPTMLHSFGVGPNSTFDCLAGTPCNPSTQFNFRYTLRVTMSHTHGIYESNIPLEVGGTVLIRQATRPWTLQPDIHMRSDDTFGAFIEETYPNFGEYGATTRNLQFLLSADCQYFHHFCCNSDGVENHGGIACGVLPFVLECQSAYNVRIRSNAVHMAARAQFASNPLLRGMILAGDLVQAGHPGEWDYYLNSFTEQGTKYTLLPYIFDGLGNHDYDSPQRHVIIRDHIRNHSRNTVRTFRQQADPLPHYSWDWHDIHFVQLNLMPADFAPVQAPTFNPYSALAFLQQDLAAHVGTTGRPVFVIHHFGLNEGDYPNYDPDDPTTSLWFEPGQKAAYWDAIAPYNVRGIIHGHTHLNRNAWPNNSVGGISQRWGQWERPDGASITGPSFVRTFNVAASGDHGLYLEMHMGPNNSIKFIMRDQDGIWLRERPGFNFEDDKRVFVAPGPAGSGDGDKRYPWTSVQNAVNAVMTYDAGLLNSVTPIIISPGTYNETVTANISRKVRLEATNGLVRIGQP